MNKGFMIAIISLSFTVSAVNSEVLDGGPLNRDITDLYNNILIGELFPSGNIYLERFSLDGGYDNQQHFNGLDYSEEIEIYPIKKALWRSVRASFNRVNKETYIGAAEKTSRYFISALKTPSSLAYRRSRLWGRDLRCAGSESLGSA